MIDHTGLVVSDYQRAKRFYQVALEPIGYGLLMEIPTEHTGGVEVAGFGDMSTKKPDFWISRGQPNRPAIHVALRASTRAGVDAFYRAAMAAGGTDNGAPGIRAHYHPNYYGAFVRDPDGHNIEVVCHEPA
jgi:catechol 2,3-dioxygenase-like lactoylglutathione lyase family enzyme